MTQTLLITGATDGIGFETAKRLHAAGHTVLLHGRNADKLARASEALNGAETFEADLSNLDAVTSLALEIKSRVKHLDVLINNAGVYRTSQTVTAEGLDVRFVVNTFAPYKLTRALIPIFSPTGRIVNLSSAAQAPVDLEALQGRHALSDMEAYAQSKLALTMWSMQLGLTQTPPIQIAVNPGSLLATKMVKEGFGVAGSDIGIGADILIRAALSDDFADHSGQYFDNDAGRFAPPHPAGQDEAKRLQLIEILDQMTG